MTIQFYEILDYDLELISIPQSTFNAFNKLGALEVKLIRKNYDENLINTKYVISFVRGSKDNLKSELISSEYKKEIPSPIKEDYELLTSLNNKDELYDYLNNFTSLENPPHLRIIKSNGLLPEKFEIFSKKFKIEVY